MYAVKTPHGPLCSLSAKSKIFKTSYRFALKNNISQCPSPAYGSATSYIVGSGGADLRQKAASATLPERPPLPSLLLPPLTPPILPPLFLISLLLRPLPSHPIPFSLPSPPLEVGPSNPARGSGGAHVSCPCGVWGGASRIRICCILALKSDISWQLTVLMIFSENQLNKFHAVLTLKANCQSKSN